MFANFLLTNFDNVIYTIVFYKGKILKKAICSLKNEKFNGIIKIKSLKSNKIR